jgi:hypothetical protein
MEVAVLRAPADVALARELVSRFFRAVVEESPEDLDDLLTEGATTTLGQGRQPALDSWRARLVRLDYRSLEHSLIYRESEVETYREVAGVAPHPRGAPLPVTVTGDDLLLRVPILTPRAGRKRLFGDEVWFLLKPGPNGYRIAELVENFQLP